MASKGVLVLTDETLLMDGVVAVLREHADLTISTISVGEPDLLHRISISSPMVVIMNDANSCPDGFPSAWHILQTSPRVTVIVVTQETSRIATYRQERVVGADVSNLLGIIAGAEHHSEGVDRWQ